MLRQRSVDLPGQEEHLIARTSASTWPAHLPGFPMGSAGRFCQETADSGPITGISQVALSCQLL